MTQEEALQLCDLIREESRLQPATYQIANGEHVTLVRHVFLWSESDWHRLKRREWPKSLRKIAMAL